LGRVLAEDIVADTDLPPFNRAQMAGYAVRAQDVKEAPARLRIAGESAAGKGWHQQLEEGQAVSIKAGEVVLRSGTTINAAMMAVLAAFGYARVAVFRKPRMAVLATGSELVAVDQKPGQDQIRDSNNYSISAYAELAGAIVERMPLTGDETSLLKGQISEAAKRSDLIVTSGGVSMGVYDLTKAALRELEAEIFFERVALRPGKPTVFARMPNGTFVFGLPGNPVSVAVTF